MDKKIRIGGFDYPVPNIAEALVRFWTAKAPARLAIVLDGNVVIEETVIAIRFVDDGLEFSIQEKPHHETPDL